MKILKNSKNTFSGLLLQGVILFTLLFSGCTKDISEEAPLGEGDAQLQNEISNETKNTLIIDKGEIGIKIDTRKLAVLGYKPTKVTLDLEGTLNSYSKNDIVVNENTNVAIFKLAIKDLSLETLNAMGEGVTINITVFDEANLVLETKSITSFIISKEGKTVVIDTDKTRILSPLSFDPAKPYYIQLAGENKFLSVIDPLNTNGSPRDGNIWFDSYRINNPNKEKFYLTKLGDGTYEIKTVSGLILGYQIVYSGQPRLVLYEKAYLDELISYGLAVNPSFVLTQTDDGLIKIGTTGGKYMSSKGYYLGPLINLMPWLSLTGTVQDQAKFSILAANAVWQFEDIGTEYSQPIIPPAVQDFAFQQTIRNCASSTFEAKIGITETQETTTTISLDEEINIFSSSQSGESATVEAEASGQIFGVGVNVKASGTLSSSETTGFGETKTLGSSTTQTYLTDVSFERTITLLPYTAVEAFDVYQSIPNVTMAYVQRWQIKGSDNGKPLSGTEIVTQLMANQFGGVITQVGLDFVKLSTRGTVTVKNYIKVTNNVKDIAGACN